MSAFVGAAAMLPARRTDNHDPKLTFEVVVAE
jgi:hypothetical protein